jgi:hypothetical protein
VSHTQRPRLLFFGTGDVAAGLAGLLQADDGDTDNGAAYRATATTNAIVAATPSQEVVCFATYATVRHLLTDPLPVTLLLYVDERDPISRSFTIPASQRLQLSRFEIGWADTVTGGGAAVRQAPRGHRIRVGVEFPPPAVDGAVLDIDGIECEIELLSEGISPSNAE